LPNSITELDKRERERERACGLAATTNISLLARAADCTRLSARQRAKRLR
jgi:hypothetical protein